ncbi:MAG: UvrD-helicase domain-containing protein [Candidatus Accumulibacter sp.]|jgi:ATP-dependent helicase/nuclease subunit A|nr:UvrD-helicase domain-containing protein [Accumulibacter sp.]
MKTPSEELSRLTAQALDPDRSVVVEACAGSGKTWLLASRIVRLLLAGVAPGAILAITFTRKAAREIEERVVDWLRWLATCGDDDLAAFLAERGLTLDDALLRTARGLYESVLAARPALTVNTFHGWFLQLVAAAPLSAKLAGTTLAEFDSRLFDEVWQSFADALAKRPEGEPTRAFVALLDIAGLESTRRLMRRAHDRRSEWLALGTATGADGVALTERLVADLREQLDAGEPGEALIEFFAENWKGDVQAYLELLEMSDLKTDRGHAAALREVLALPTGDACFALLRGVVLTTSDTLRKRDLNEAAERRFTPEGAARLVALHTVIGKRAMACLERQAAERILFFNRQAYAVFAAFLEHVEAFKRARRQIDFNDAEWQVLRLLRDNDTAAFLQARLDARYKHVLLDEFQDTNPLQWQILRAWFDAYSDADLPRVFLVGDPKQSIYRFRRAEPRLFKVAADFLQDNFAALKLEHDATRRNAPPIVEAINALFLGVAEFEPFRAQSSLADGLPGRVELLPLCERTSSGEIAPERRALRNPLTEPDVEPEDIRRHEEAAALAAKILEIVGRDGLAWQIDARDASGGNVRRAARYGDFMLLVRSRTHLACYERALAAVGIPFDAGSRGGLLDALEVRDVVALLEFLITPDDDLKLAQTLRSPLFACSDAELTALAAAVAATGEKPKGGAPWWPCLLDLAASDAATPRLGRAARLLGDWLRIAGQLPVHDLLDRIYHQGEVLARYRLATPSAAAPGVEANLRALLLLSLDLDGGRYPSLPRFIDALRELREADANDAPDEGRIEAEQGPTEADAGRVRILTIHGAKGLEAPIVWLLGANDSPRGGEAWDVLVDWPPTDDAPRHFSFFGRKEDRGAARQPLFDAEAAAARREELNLLYVTLTRARQVFIASGIENAKGGDGTPYRLLETALAKLDSPGAYGDTLPTIALPDDPPPEETSGAVAALPAIGERRPEAQGGERFGILLHALLERRTQDDEAAAWCKALGFDEGEYRRALPVAKRLLAASHLRRFFAPELYCRAWNEAEFADGAGNLRRIDRLVEFADGLWVLDYKSSGRDTSRIADYRAQVAAYCRMVAAAHPGRAVRGALLFADTALVEVDWIQD